MPAIVMGAGDSGSCLLIGDREREIACPCKDQSRRIIEQLLWNCRMTRVLGEEAAESCSSQKENVDITICDYAKELDGHNCFSKLSQGMQEQLAAYCCSADQPSDYDDNSTGRECGGRYVCGKFPFYQSCEGCCNREGLDKNTPEGPGTSRPCSELLPEKWQHLLP